MGKLLENLTIHYSYAIYHTPISQSLACHPWTSPCDFFFSRVGSGAVCEDYLLSTRPKIQSGNYSFRLLDAFCYSNKALKLDFLRGRKIQCFSSMGEVSSNSWPCKILQRPLRFPGTLTCCECYRRLLEIVNIKHGSGMIFLT